jgi:hypothetical protein
MASTDKGIVYPTSGDNIAPLETHFASLAQSADDAITEVETLAEEIEESVSKRISRLVEFRGQVET